LTAGTLDEALINVLSGRRADRIGRVKVPFLGLSLAVVTPFLYGSAYDALTMAIIYVLNRVAFWTIQTVGFTFAEDKRVRLFSRCNTVAALGWGSAGLLVGGPLADIQTRIPGLPAYTACGNKFYISSIIVTLGTKWLAVKIAKVKVKNH